MESLPQQISLEGARKDLETIQAVCDKYGVRLWLTYGALLGIHRDGDFIPYDDDIDLCITDKLDYKTRKQIGWELLGLGFGLQPITFRLFNVMEPAVPGYNGDDHSGIIVCQRNIRVTLFFFGEEECAQHGSEFVCRPLYGCEPLIAVPSRYFQSPGTKKFKGKQYSVPTPIDEYLEWVYGRDWKKPIKDKHALKWHELHNQN